MQPSAQFVPTAGAKAAGNTGYAVVNGTLQGSATGRLPLGGNVIDVTARVIPDKPSVGAAVGKFLFKAAWPLQVGVAAFDLVKELGYLAERDASGTLTLKKADTTVCTVAPCYAWQAGPNYFAQYMPVQQASTKEALCLTKIQPLVRHPGTNVAGGGRAYLSGNSCLVAYDSPYTNWYTFEFPMTQVTVAPSPPAYQPVTQQELADKIASQSGWPSSSAFPEVVRQAVESGETITAPTPTVTGPSSVQGPKSTATEGGRTVEKQTVYNITYNNNQVSYTTTVTTVTTAADGTKTTATETKENEPPPDECAKNPDSLNCADLDVPAGQIPRTTKNIAYTPESWFGGGSCPADKTMTTHGMTLKVWDWTGSCYWLVNYFRPILLIIATSAALMIVVPKGGS